MDDEELRALEFAAERPSRLRSWTGRQLRRLADRIDWHGAPKLMSWTFTFEQHQGIVFRQDGKGCRMAYLGNDEYEKAHAEADSA